MPYSKFRRLQAIRKRGSLITLWTLVALLAGFSPTGLGSPEILTLQQALQLAVSHSPDVVLAENGVLTSELSVAKKEAFYRARITGSTSPIDFFQYADEVHWSYGEPVVISGSLAMPSGLTVSAEGRVNNSDARTADLELTLSFRLWPPPSSDSNLRSLSESRKSLLLSQAKNREAQLLAAASAYRQYRSLQAQEANLALLERDKLTKEAIFTQTVHKFENGAASQLEVLEAELDRDRSRASWEKAVRDYRADLSSFLSDLGVDSELPQLERLPGEWPGLISLPDEEVLMDEAVASSTSILERRQALESAKGRLEAAQTNNGWTVSVKAIAQRPSFDDNSVSYAARLDANYDLMDGGVREAERKEAEITCRQAEQALAKEIENVKKTVKSKAAELVWLEDQYKIARKGFEKSYLEHEIKGKQYDRGLIRELDYEESSRVLQEARLEWLKSGIAYEAARLELLALTGEALNIEGGITVEITAQEVR